MPSCPKRNCCRRHKPFSRVFARLGREENRTRARIKFLVAQLGIEEFKHLVPRNAQHFHPTRAGRPIYRALHESEEKPLRAGAKLERYRASRRASTIGTRPISGIRNRQPAMSRPSLPCRSATSPRIRCARGRYRPPLHQRDTFARPWTRTRPALDQRSRPARSVFRVESDRLGQRWTRAPSWTSPPAPARTPASSASLRHAAWRGSCASVWRKKSHIG